MIFKLRNTNLRSDGTNFFVRYIPSPPPSSSSSSQGSSSGGSSQGPNSILACGFGSFNDGQFTSAGYYNNYEYYTYIDGATTWYLFYDTANTRYTISTVLSNGNTHYYNLSGYISFDWLVSSGSSPGGDTYDYTLTSQCPQSSSSSSSSGSGNTEGPTAILACGFGSFPDGQFASTGYYLNYEYYTLLDGATTWYLFYSGGGQFVISPSLGGAIYYYSSSYIYNDWITSSGASPGGDTYDYDLTSQCPPLSSSSSSSSSGPETPIITSIGYDGITFQWGINISNFSNFMMPSWLIQYSTDNLSWGSSFSPSSSSNPYLYVDESSYNLPTYSNGTDFYVRVSADNGSNWSISYFVDN